MKHISKTESDARGLLMMGDGSHLCFELCRFTVKPLFFLQTTFHISKQIMHLISNHLTTKKNNQLTERLMPEILQS